MATMSDNGLLSLLFPIGQLLISGCVVVVMLVSFHRLLGRGPSRMSRALLVTGGAAVAVAVLGILLSSH
jgi:hypothetical protein